jgi:hypothetical protein
LVGTGAGAATAPSRRQWIAMSSAETLAPAATANARPGDDGEDRREGDGGDEAEEGVAPISWVLRARFLGVTDVMTITFRAP